MLLVLKGGVILITSYLESLSSRKLVENVTRCLKKRQKMSINNDGVYDNSIKPHERKWIGVIASLLLDICYW